MVTFFYIAVSVVFLGIPTACFYLGRIWERRDATVTEATHLGATPDWHPLDMPAADIEPVETVAETTEWYDAVSAYPDEIAILHAQIDAVMTDVWANVEAVKRIHKPVKRRRTRSCRWYEGGIPEPDENWGRRVNRIRVNSQYGKVRA